MNKKGFEFSFSWLFAMIAGAVIIFLAVYATTKLIGTETYRANTENAAQIDAILSGAGTGVESARYGSIRFPAETRVFNKCRNLGVFGEQIISSSVKSGIGEKWQPEGVGITSKDKYLFSSSTLEGREVYLFIKPFSMPYKVADVIIAYNEEYCFINAPQDIEDEISSLGLPMINFTESVAACSAESVKVCFSGSCDVLVLDNRVRKQGRDVYYYSEALMYGAIFSDIGIYECQAGRLLKRTGELAELYATKSELLTTKGCSSGFHEELRVYADSIKSEGIASFETIGLQAEQLEVRNEALSCKLF